MYVMCTRKGVCTCQYKCVCVCVFLSRLHQSASKGYPLIPDPLLGTSPQMSPGQQRAMPSLRKANNQVQLPFLQKESGGGARTDTHTYICTYIHTFSCTVQVNATRSSNISLTSISFLVVLLDKSKVSPSNTSKPPLIGFITGGSPASMPASGGGGAGKSLLYGANYLSSGPTAKVQVSVLSDMT